MSWERDAPMVPPLLAAIEQQLARGLPTRWWLRVDDAAQLVPAVALDAATVRAYAVRLATRSILHRPWRRSSSCRSFPIFVPSGLRGSTLNLYKKLAAFEDVV